ncbi:MAG TPA: G8 domain-containing protein [Puia sp.]|nr:G8 domain-containing protein [Puia sp.]
MKTKLYTLLLLAIPSVALAGARTLNEAISNGSNWSSTSTWSLGRVPASGDSIVIPAGKTVIFDQSATLNNVYITIGGTLNFNQNNSLALDNVSIVSILSGGMLTATHPTPNELLSVGGVNKYDGKTDNTIAGPALASSSTGTSPTGFTVTPITLPVTFVSFSADRSSDGPVQLTWNTANEIDNSHFEIERSLDGSDWTSVATVAAGNSSLADTYNYNDATAPVAQTWYRIRQVDLDGKYLYSKIVLAGATANAQATIIASGRTVTIFPEKLAGGRLMVRLITPGGQVLQQQSFESASSRIDLSLSTSANGIYLVQVTDGSQWSVVKKVML